MEESRRYKFTSYYYRLLSARLIFVVLFENVIATITSLMRWIIPDVPQQLRQQMRQHAYLTNELILQQEFARAKEISDAEKMQAAKKRMRSKGASRQGRGGGGGGGNRGNGGEGGGGGGGVSSAGSAAERASIDSVGVHTVVSFVHSAAMEQRFARDRRVEMSARERQSAYNSRKVNRSVGDVPGGGNGGGGLTPQSTGYLMKTVSVEEEEVDDALEEEVSSANSRTAILSDDVVSLNTGGGGGRGGGGRGGDMRGGGDIGGGGGGGSSSSLTDGTNSFYNAYLAEATSTDQLIGGRGDGGNGDK